MTTEEAKANIGKPFKWIDGGDGVCGRFDIIRHVNEKGIVYGDFLCCPVADARFKKDQPEQLKKSI